MKVKGITHITFKEEPEKAVQYWMETTDPVIHYDTNKITNTSSFTVTCKKRIGAGSAENCSEFRLCLEHFDGTQWLSTTYSKRASLSVATDSSYTRYRVKAVDDSGAVVCEINVEAIFDGAIGPAGTHGAIYLCRGEWNNQEPYIKTDDVVHYVIYEGYAYEPKQASVTGGNNPLADVQAGGANWKSLGRYDVIATRVLLANFALIAGAVFWNNKLMSQYGTNNSGATVNDYTNYSEDANGNETGTFHPNILIDFLKGYLKAVKGKIGNFSIEGNNLVAAVGSNQLTLNATNGKITLTSSRSGGSYAVPGESNYPSTITLDVATGVVEARNSKGVAYMSASGIFCNNAATQAVSATMGVDNKAAICGLGFGTVDKDDWQNENFIAGVYGRAYNNGTAPAFGGFFRNLMAAGLFLKTKMMESATSSQLVDSDSLVIGLTSGQKNVYLPNDGVIGRTIFFKQWWTGYMRVYTTGGQVIYDDSTENTYIDVGEGYVLICMFAIAYIGGVKKEVWLTSKSKGNI
jgi:hypothetical protein